jgi:hypothetical protein
MRFLIACLPIVVAVGSAAAPKGTATQVAKKPVAAAMATQSLPIFSFLGDTTEAVSSRAMLNSSKCTTEHEITECSDYSRPKIGGVDLKTLSIKYNRGLLYEVISLTWSDRYAALLEVFSLKYGSPSLTVEKWQSKSGAVFDNSIATWHFKNGLLRLEALGPDVNTADFIFTSTVNAPPRPTPNIDF